MIKEAIKKIVDKQDLTYDEAYAVMNEIMSGETSAVENAAYLAALSTKSSGMETIDEISGSAAAMREHAQPVTHEMEVVKSIAKRAILLEGGKIIGSGSIEELFLKPDEKMKEFLGEVEILPSTGTNIRLFFPKEVAQNSVITHMARSLNIDFNIVWGKLEKLNDNVLGSLVINIDEKDKENVLNYIKQSGVLWEVA